MASTPTCAIPFILERLEFFGLLIIRPTQVIALACVLGIIWVLIQTRLEELDLLQRLPVYREYMRRVPRFVPRFWGRNTRKQPR